MAGRGAAKLAYGMFAKVICFSMASAKLIQQMVAVNRPFGISLLAILHILQAILCFVGGIALFAFGAFVHRGFGMHRFLGGIASFIGVVVLVIGLLYLGLAWGLWFGKGWAWTISLVLAALGIIVSFLSLFRGRVFTLIILLLDIIIIYYLLTPRVRTFFGEYKPPVQPQQPTQSIQFAPQPTSGSKFCSNCGVPLLDSDKFCSHCGKALQ